jgi:hypothetical protein
MNQKIAVCALLSGSLCACNVTGSIPGLYTGALNGGWTVSNVATQQTFQFGAPNATVNIQPQGTYSVAFWATSPAGVTKTSWSGVGAFYCYNGPVLPSRAGPGGPEVNTPTGYIGTEPGSWPAYPSTFNPPQSTAAMFNPTFVVPCGPGGNQGYADIAAGHGSTGLAFGTPSSAIITAHATDNSGATLSATLTLTVVESGGL